MKAWFYHMLCGLCMGTADVIPGVSGGTMAWILGIYARLIAAVDMLRGDFLKDVLRARLVSALKQVDWALLLPLVAGVIMAVLVMVKWVGLPQLLREYPSYVYAIFFGLILASVPLLLRSSAVPRWCWGWLVIGIAGGLALTHLVPVSLPESPWLLFVAGALAISAMLLPGVSGSYLLLVLGQYTVILEAIDQVDFAKLVPFIAGCVCGLVVFAKALNWLLKRYYSMMVWLMGGLLLGSLPKVWPWQIREYTLLNGKQRLTSSELFLPPMTQETAVIFALAILGALLIWLLGRIAALRGGVSHR